MVDCDWETWQIIEREIREGTPDTPERIATMRRADEVYRRSGLSTARKDETA